MTGPAFRSRVLDVQRSLVAAQHGRTLLDQKREALQRELTARLLMRQRTRGRAQEQLTVVRRLCLIARTEVSGRGLMLAAAAQQLHLTITRTEHSIVGVRLPDVTVRKGNLALRYTLSDSSASVDDCARAAALALEHLIDYAREESAVRRLRAALARTARRLNALDLLVIPQLEHELHDVVAAIEEEERDERLRTKRWIASQSECAP